MSARAQFAHLALPARRPQEVAGFYRDFLGLDVTLEGALPALGDFVFLSDRPAEESQTLTFMTRAEAQHTAWRVESLAALKGLYAEARERNIPVDRALNHGVTLSLYLRDPEGNGVELFWPTGQTPEGVYARPVDLDQSEETLQALVAAPNPA